MKNFITINQGNFIAIGKLKNIKVDTTDGLLFDWIQNFTNSQKAFKKLIDNKLYIWVSYKAIREDNPMAHINTNDVVGRRLNKLVDLGILDKYFSKEDGSKTFFHITEFAYKYLLEGVRLESSTLPTQKSEGVRLESRRGTTQKSDNSKLIDSYNSKLIDNKENKEKKTAEILPPELNTEAFKMWIEYKGKNYSKQGRTLTINKLIKYPKDVQLQMVENSIMNSYKGLFEVKPTSTAVSTQTKPKQNQKSIAEVLIEYVQDRQNGFTQEIATLQAKEKLNWGLHKDLAKVIQDKEYEWYMQNRAAKQQSQPQENDDEYVKRVMGEL